MIGKYFSNGWKIRGGFSNDWKNFGSSGNLVESMGGAVGAVGDALLAPEPCPRPRPAGGPGPLGSNVRPSPRDGICAKSRQ